jgi:hypothetical protein
MNLKQLVFILLTFSFVGISCQKEDMPVYDYRKLGTASKDILSDQNYTSLEIQINYMPGYAPADTVINHFKKLSDSVGSQTCRCQFATTVGYAYSKQSYHSERIGCP